jgi:hypothetical protein
MKDEITPPIQDWGMNLEKTSIFWTRQGRGMYHKSQSNFIHFSSFTLGDFFSPALAGFNPVTV